MRQLRFVRVEDAGHLLVQTADGTEQFALLADERFLAAVRPAPAPPVTAPVSSPPSPPPATEPAADVEIGPREIQTRIRAGESPEDLAASLGVPLSRVMRFAGPVMDERLRIADEARRARAHRSGRDGTETAVVQFGEAVDTRFTAHGITPSDVTWDARRRDDGEWIVEATWEGGEGQHTAAWVFLRSSRSVNPLDDTATDLLSDRPIRPVTPPEPERTSLSAAPPLAPGVVAFPPMPDAHTGPLPKYQEVFDQEAPAEGPRDVPPFVPAGEAVLEFDAPPLPLGITDPSTRPGAAAGGRQAALSALTNISRTKRDETEDDRAARARVPSWDDILLGVRRKQD